ncbi:MAG TPA: hypothetical protein VFS78_06765, partial [Vicinamibacteria bacterium]|nr:hypothetical protein [Vicinamibacteria bacterium]
MRRVVAVGALAAGLAAGLPASARAQTAIELCGSTASYRFADLNHTFSSGVMLDALYVGVPGQDEFYLGLGYTWKASHGLTVIPLAYAVAGVQKEERGVVLGAYVLGDAGPWKLIAFAGRFVRIAGGVSTYDFGDSLDLTYKVAKRWDAGVSSSVYRQDTGWSHLTGPVVRRSDARGSWALSVRSGYDTEVRLVRILT